MHVSRSELFRCGRPRNAPACFQPTSAEQVMSPILWMPAGDPVALSTTVAVSFKRSLGTPVPP